MSDECAEGGLFDYSDDEKPKQEKKEPKVKKQPKIKE